MGFAVNSDVIKQFHYLEAEEIDSNILTMCDSGLHSQNLNTVLREWKYSMLNNMKAEQEVFRSYLVQIFSQDTLNAMEGILHYERQTEGDI